MKCLVCENENLKFVLSLGNQPLANSYHTGVVLPKYPLDLYHCSVCKHHQLGESVDPKEMFDEYAYVSGTSNTLRRYFEEYADFVLGFSPTLPSVLEIACNDGTLLECFRNRGCADLTGIDPAQNICKIACEKGLSVVPKYWNSSTQRELGRAFDAVVAVNVLPHVPDPLVFLKSCRNALSPNGKLFVQTSQCTMFRDGEFDAIYHEHTSYFSAPSFYKLAERAGMRVVHADVVPIHSNSFRFVLQKGADGGTPSESLLEEVPYDSTTLAQKAERTSKKFRSVLHDARAMGWTVVGYGAAAKGNTFLGYCEDAPEYIVDDNPLKVGLLTPGSNIPILSPTTLAADERPLLVIVLAWNFYKEIVERVHTLRRGATPTRVVRFIPKFEVTKF